MTVSGGMVSSLDAVRAARGEPSAYAITVAPARPIIEPFAAAVTRRAEPMRSSHPRRADSPHPRTLTAAAKVVGDASPNQAGSGRRTAQDWQEEAWSYYDLVGELKASATFIANCVSRVRLTVGWVGTDGKPGAAFDEDGQPIPEAGDVATLAEASIASLRSQTGGQSQLLRAVALNVTIPGEVNIVGTDILDPATGLPAGRQWEALSTSELRQTADGVFKRYPQPSSAAEDLPAGAYTFRVWQPHPRYSILADSAVRGCLEILEELVLLTRKVRAEALSRLAGAGLLFMPEEISLAYANNQANEDGSEEDDPFTRDLISTTAAAMEGTGNAAELVPHVITAPGQDIGKVRWMTFDRSADPGLVEKRKEAVLRLAQGLDLPVEVVTGHMQTTFANAAQIDEATWKAYIEPKVELICDGLTSGYLRPLLLAAGEDPARVARLCIWYDPSALVTHPNREDAAMRAFGTAEHPTFLISAKAAAHVLGFSDADMPDEEEITERVRVAQLLKVRESVPGVVPESADTGIGDASSSDAGVSTAPSTAPGIGVSPPAGPAAPEPAPGLAASAGPDDQVFLSARTAAAAEVAVERAAERAGARLRSKAVTQPHMQARIDGVPNCDVARTLGADTVVELLPEDQLLAGEFSALERTVRRWAADAGMDDAAAGVYAGKAVRFAEQLAVGRLGLDGQLQPAG